LGLAAYFRERDAAKISGAAVAARSAPDVFAEGPSGGIMLHRPGETRPSEHLIKSGQGGKTYLSHVGESGHASDCEGMSFDGNRLVLCWLDEFGTRRYGTMFFDRCRKIMRLAY
jgi:hypothetical protein